MFYVAVFLLRILNVIGQPTPLIKGFSMEELFQIFCFSSCMSEAAINPVMTGKSKAEPYYQCNLFFASPANTYSS